MNMKFEDAIGQMDGGRKSEKGREEGRRVVRREERKENDVQCAADSETGKGRRVVCEKEETSEKQWQ